MWLKVEALLVKEEFIFPAELAESSCHSGMFCIRDKGGLTGQSVPHPSNQSTISSNIGIAISVGASATETAAVGQVHLHVSPMS
jgi:hypothetical protein